MSTINLKDVQRALNVLLDHLIKNRGMEVVTLEKDYYWHVPSETLYDMDLDPPKLGINIGSLCSDLELMNTVLREDSAPIGYQLSQMAPLLRYLGEATSMKAAAQGG